jgi:ribosomal protein S18 acetylase RimI-like enzyme
VHARSATLGDFDGLVALWKAAGLRMRLEPLAEELASVLARDPELVMVVEDGGAIVASVLGTWDGRRGWVNRLATHPGHRGRGLARLLITELEERLRAKGCRKLNLLIEPDNAAVVAWYERLGYRRSDLIFMDKLL